MAEQSDSTGETIPADDASEETSAGTDEAVDEATVDEAADVDPTVAAYDLDDDGRVSATEDLRADLGIADAMAEEASHEPGLKGKFGKLAHKVLDKLDND